MKYLVRIVQSASVLLMISLMPASVTFAGGPVKSRVSPQWVDDNLNSVKVVDLRYKQYAEGHIPGAVQMKWGSEVYEQDPEYMLPPNLSEIKRVIDKMGLTQEDHIVLYDADADQKQVMRLYWAFKYWNFPKVSIIKGGLALWEKENRPLADTRIADKNKE